MRFCGCGVPNLSIGVLYPAWRCSSSKPILRQEGPTNQSMDPFAPHMSQQRFELPQDDVSGARLVQSQDWNETIIFGFTRIPPWSDPCSTTVRQRCTNGAPTMPRIYASLALSSLGFSAIPPAPSTGSLEVTYHISMECLELADDTTKRLPIPTTSSEVIHLIQRRQTMCKGNHFEAEQAIQQRLSD